MTRQFFGEGSAAMDLFARVKGILLSPEREWRMIERESGEPAHLFVRYVAPLALIPAVCGFIGMSVIGVTVSAGIFRVPAVSGLVYAAITYCFTFVIVYVVALIIDFLAPYFGARRYFPSALKLAVYSFTPVWLSGLFLLLPGLQVLTILSLYGLYLLWVGLHWLMLAPRGKGVFYVVIVGLCTFGITIALALIQSRVL
jgi:hypothetical protein